MVKAELEYNPYLLETKIKFNGQSPRINSLVEKYETGALRNWINKVPKVFYDEMNGYDFELEFSGTERDFDELKKSFMENGVSEEQVHIFHKNILAGRKEKTQKIDELQKWLSENKNTHFDYDGFRAENRDLLEGQYPFIVINGYGLDVSAFDDTDISIELIEDVKELEHTALDDTPILINVTGSSLSSLGAIVSKLIIREDVSANQLFFTVDASLSPAHIERIITDIGIAHPQMVTSVNDEVVLRYMELYPQSDYIYDTLRAFRSKVDELTASLEEENQVKAEANREVYEKLDELEGIINRLKRTQEHFEDDYNSEIPQLWQESAEALLKLVNGWKIKKTILKKVDEAERYASEFEADAMEGYSKYLQEMECLYEQAVEVLSAEYEGWYSEAQYEDGYKPEVDSMMTGLAEEVPPFKGSLLELKQEQYVDAKEGILERIFKESTDEPKEKVLETTFYLQNWRSYVNNLVEPLVKKVLSGYFSSKCDFEKKIRAEYIAHLSEEILKKNEERSKVSSQLSDDERQLQNDNDWLREFDDKLRNIERC